MAPKLLFFKTLWGVFDSDCGPFPLADGAAVFARIKAMGYDGVEAPVATMLRYGASKFKTDLEANGLEWIALVFSCGLAPTPGNLGLKSEIGLEHPADNEEDSRDIARHKAVWNAQVQEALALRPVLRSITSHTGKDYFTASEAEELFSYCTAIESAFCGPTTPINHETHRGRILYTPWTTPEHCSRHPSITLCADLSHFVCVAEAECSQKELNRVVTEITPRVRHIHARIGFPEGPQLADPRAKWCARHVEGHMRWWAGIFDAAAAAGRAAITVTPEFGPADYVPVDAEGAPVSNIWEVNHWVALQIQDAYRAKYGPEYGSLVPDTEDLPRAV